MDCVVRQELNKMVEWWIGINTNFGVSTGKVGNYFNKHLPASYWDQYKATYSDGDYENMWDSLFIAGELFRTLAKEIADNRCFSYPSDEDESITAYLNQVRYLSPDAIEIFE